MSLIGDLGDCWYCLDGLIPAGIHTIIGPVYANCPFCTPTCVDCDGAGLYPADFDCLACMANHLIVTYRLVIVLCPGCFGVTDLVPLDTTPEGTPHVHH
jgi:hypothetical protein